AILRAVARYRMLTTVQVERLFFSTTRSGEARRLKANTRCQYRLQMLFHRGYLRRDELPQKLSEGRKPYLYWLDELGAQVIATQAGDLLEEPGWDPREREVGALFLEHLRATNDVRLAVEIAAQTAGWIIPIWIDDKTLKKQQMKDYVSLLGPSGGRSRA